ncbi:outer membrane protein assembly factor BamB family protein [Streptomyces hydrogenans]|uniref:outer membrane protein assembly factor BamB family protein n=1 Tax=Streptomyces hydrogenans TaxID=1873719 RepID=UPI0035DF4E35
MNPNHHAKKKAKELTRHNGLSYAANLAQVVREMTAIGAAQSPSPYSTGGGGIVLEHRFGAVLLSHLLTGRPVPALGDHITPTHVRFQGHAISRVDDILVRGRSSAGAEHLLSVGVRRRPRLVASDAKSVQLVEAFLDVVISQWPLLRSGRRRLALAVVPACRPAHQLADLAVVAAAAASSGEFRRRMAQGGHASKEVRDRLVQFDALVTAAVPAGRIDGAIQRPAELAWRLLSKLSLIELRLEGADLSDRTQAVGQLQRLTPHGLASEADALFSHLAELVGIYAPSGSEVDLASLMADLEGLPHFVPPAGPVIAAGVKSVPGVQAHPAAVPGVRGTAANSRQDVVVWSQSTVSGKAVQPVLADGTLVVRDGYWLLGFDAATGEPMRPLQTAFSSLPVIGDGQVFVADRERRIVSVDLRAGRKGQPLPAHMLDAAAVVDHGTLFAASPNAHIHAVDLASQVLLWALPVSGIPVAPPQVHAGRVFLQTGTRSGAGGAAEDSSLWAFTTAGALQWVHEQQDGALLHWSVLGEHVYVFSRHEADLHKITALDVPSGQTCWQYAFTGELIGRPAVGDHALYLTMADGVIALDNGTGRDRWRTAGAFGRVAAAAHAGDGVVYVGLWQPRCLIALDADTGAELWRKKTTGSFTSTPFSASGIVYGGHRGGVLHGWNARSRREVWRAEVMWDEARQGTPLLVDGRAYVTSSNGKIYALALHV